MLTLPILRTLHMNILALDYGKKRIGLAWVNTDLGVVLPYGVIANDEGKKKNEELEKLIKDEKIDTLVIGLPVDIETRGENANTKKIRAWGEGLEKTTGLPVDFIDESFTTHEAKEMGGEASLDEKSAMLILQEYLDTRKQSKR